jgi:biopolymer transport protein ExbD
VISGGGTSVSPPPSRTQPTTQAPRILVSISSKGEIFVGSAQVADDALPRMLRDRAAGHKDTVLVIKADRSVSAARINFVADRAKEAGLRVLYNIPL